MTLQVQGGWLDGNNIRKARKPYRCQYWRGKEGRCDQVIPVGGLYVEGELSDCNPTRNGVFLQDKYCPRCAGPEAIVTIALIGA